VKVQVGDSRPDDVDVLRLRGAVALVSEQGTSDYIVEVTGEEFLYYTETEGEGLAQIQAANVQGIASSDVYMAAQDGDRTTRGAFEGVINGDDSQAIVVAKAVGGTPAAQVTLEAVEASGSSVLVDADKLHFDNGTPITRPTLDTGTVTAAQVAQALIDLGLCQAP